MIELKKEFTMKGVKFSQKYKDDELVIYELSYVDYPKKWYEVFKLKVFKPDIYHNDTYEKYPRDESFGNWAWCSSNLDSVRKVLRKHFPNHRLTDNDEICSILGVV